MSAAPMYEFNWGARVPLPVRYRLGLDLGKVSDYSALAILEERPERCIEEYKRAMITPVWGDDPDFALPWLQRWPLMTAYGDIAAAVAKLVADLAGRPATEVTLLVDATGVGTAVVEILLAQEASRALTYRDGFIPVTITAGDATTRGYETAHGVGYRTCHVPKKELVGAAQMALQRQKLKVAASLPEAATLVEELRNFEVRLTQAANATFNAREGQHDDLVLAVALPLWGARALRPNYVMVSNYRSGTGRADIPQYGNGTPPYGPNAPPSARRR
jgi:hypothetical protein